MNRGVGSRLQLRPPAECATRPTIRDLEVSFEPRTEKNFMKGNLKNKKALFCFWSLELGGAERQGLHLARYLNEQGCDVTVFSCVSGAGLVSEICDRLMIPYAVHRFLWPCRKTSLLRDGYRLWRAIRRLDPDIVIPYTTPPNVGCGLVWRWTSAKACIWGQRNVNQNELTGHWIERLAYRRSSAVICNATHMVDHLARILGEPEAPVHVIPNGIELAPCVKSREEWRTELRIGRDSIAVILVANFRPVKDHATLIRAWRKVLDTIPDTVATPTLLLAGAQQFSYQDAHALTHELGLSDSVQLLGQVKDVSGLLAASDIGVLCSTHEGLSNSLIEYMASGLPVVATDLPGNREALGEDPLQPFCKPQDANNLAVCLQTMVLDAERRLRAGERNRQRAAEHFSIQAMCKSTAGVITDLIAPVKTNQ